MKIQRNPNRQSNIEELEKSCSLTSDYKVTATETVWHWHKNRYLDRWDRIKSRNKPMHLWSINLWESR